MGRGGKERQEWQIGSSPAVDVVKNVGTCLEMFGISILDVFSFKIGYVNLCAHHQELPPFNK